MSIHNDDRQYSDDPDEYEEWKSELAWEYRNDSFEYDEDLVVNLDEEEGAE